MLKGLLTFIFLLVLASAIGYLLFPSKMLSVVGIDGNQQLDFLMRTTGAALAALLPGLWASRSSPTSPVSRAVLFGMVGYLFLGSVVDLVAYKQSIVNSVSVPSIALRFVLGAGILLLMRKKRRRKVELQESPPNTA